MAKRSTETSITAFVRAHTRVVAPFLCPEILLHLALDMEALWESQEAWMERTGLPPPFWSVPWVGGQALARYTLDHPTLFRDQAVLDFGSGSGICAIAAAKAGAASVAASDVDPFFRDVVALNSRVNHVSVEPLCQDIIGTALRWNVVLVGDLWYERFLAQRLNAWLQAIARAGCLVLLGDCGRAFFPRRAITQCARYIVATSPTIEREASTIAGVWRMN